MRERFFAMSSTNNPLINNCRQKIQYALSDNKPVPDDDTANMDVDEAIINGVRDRPHLYDPRRFGYRNAGKRDNSFSAIGSQLNMTGDEVAKRWKALRDRFAREKRLTDASKKWRFFSQLTFLSDHIKCKRTSSNAFDSVDNTSDLEVGTPSGNGADNCDAAQSINLEHPSAGANPREDMSECSSPSLHTSGPPPKRQRRTMNIDIINTLRNVSQALKSNLYNHAKPLETMDGEMAFGIAVSHRLKRLTPKQSSLAQFRIQQLLYEVEFGE